MKFTIIIPSRYGSSRLPGKPLVDLCGKSMIHRVWLQANKSGAENVIIATDDSRVEAHCHGFGADVCMTDSEHQSGTDRLAEVAKKRCFDDQDIIINVQGDEPLIPEQNIIQLAELLASDDKASMATLSTPIDCFDDANNPNVVKVVNDDNKNALYFSRSMIPFDRDGKIQSVNELQQYLQRHIGIYAYRAGFLKRFASWPPSVLEKLEQLEQLRVLQRGFTVKIEQAGLIPPAGIDTKEDVARVVKFLQDRDD